MKNMMCHQIAVLVLLAGICFSCNTNKAQDATQKDRVVLNASPGLYELTSEWAAVYCKLNPEMDIEVLKISESTSAEDLENTAQLSFITRDFVPDIYDGSLWKVTVGRDIIVPVINEVTL